MKVHEFINEFEENVVFVKKDTLNLDTQLENLDEWDSMATVSTIALIDDKLGIQVNAESLTNCKTLGDIVTLIKGNLEV